MCGIFGVFDFTGHAEIGHERLRTMADTMVHRGPDDEGTYLSPDRRVGFGFRRLSIVDLEGGHQPMSNAGCPKGGQSVYGPGNERDGTVWVVFNGEIYNHEELRVELEASGHVYVSRSDTETIVHGYEEWGPDVVHRLRGVFAFAIHDARSGEQRSDIGGPLLFMARDRLGVKPLYYSERGGRVLFASEIKAILAWPGVPREVDDEALYHSLTLSVTPAPLTMFRDIHKLPPGNRMLVYPDGRTERTEYWDPLDADLSLESATESEIVQRLRELLRESIRLRMMSDVPFGVFLSGGVDSSLNVGLMSELMDRPVDTFSVAIEDDPLSDERSSARRVAQYFGANHHEVLVASQDFVDFLPEMVYHQDEPLVDPVSVPLYYVSKLARDSGTIVVQVGEGADELFAGYNGYALMVDFQRRIYGPFSALPVWMKRTAAAVGSRLLSTRRAEVLRRASAGQELFWGGAIVFTEEAKRRLLTNGRGYERRDTYAEVVVPLYNRFDQQRPGMPFLDRIIYLEMKHRLPELLLMRVDKMSMAASVESRVPYLDHKLVEFALGISSTLKYRRGRTKHILKEAARGILPDDVINRRKKGFCGGADNMVRGPVVDHAEQVIKTSEWLSSLLDLDAVLAMVGEHRSGRRNHSMAIWSLLNLGLWHRAHIEK